jgi:hypothetical protein
MRFAEKAEAESKSGYFAWENECMLPEYRNAATTIIAESTLVPARLAGRKRH